jgi:beta-lactamase superfamily II metal-dependent hydrolase
MEHLKRGQTWQITGSNREQSYPKREQNHKQNTNKTKIKSPSDTN